MTWEIDFDDDEFDSHEDAARKALEIQRNPDSIATVFTVDGEEIDLGYGEEGK